MKQLIKWVNEVSTLVKVSVVVATVIATLFGAWSFAPKSASYGNSDTPLMIEMHRQQLDKQSETNRALWTLVGEIRELKGRLSR